MGQSASLPARLAIKRRKLIFGVYLLSNTGKWRQVLTTPRAWRKAASMCGITWN